MSNLSKKIKDLSVGDIFFDSYGYKLKVEEVLQIDFLSIPGTKPKCVVYFLTESGNRMRQTFNADRDVQLV